MKRLHKGLLVALFAAALTALVALSGCGQQASDQQQASSSATQVSDAGPQLDPDRDYNKPFFCLIIGGDTRVGTSEEKKSPSADSHSDVQILAYVNPKKKYISLLSIPRDYDVTYKGKRMKINTIMLKDGPKATAKFMGKKMGISIPYYFEMDFVQWADFVDNMNGVKVDVPADLKWKDIIDGKMVKLKKGKNQTLNGKEALVLARDRHQYEGAGDAVRQKNNRNMVKSLITKVANSDNPAQYVNILLSGCKSNMNSAELTTYLSNFLQKNGKIKWNLGTAPWHGGMLAKGYWAITPDWDTVKTEVKAMKNGSKLSDIVDVTDSIGGSN